MRIITLSLLLLGLSAHAEVQRFQLDTVHTQVVFFISHMGFSNSMGVFRGVDGHFDFDEGDWSRSRAEIRVDVGSLDFGDSEWNRNSLGSSLLDVEKHPEMLFVAERFEKTGDSSGQLHGELTLRGVTRPLTLDVRLNRIGSNPLNMRRTAGFSATGVLSRSDFGVSGYSSFVGDTVHLRIEVEGQRERR